jgi:2-iminobutanoate/2-iminopropanoate deaminase
MWYNRRNSRKEPHAMRLSGSRTVRSAGAPPPVGPYSQAVVYSGLVITAGQIGIDPVTGTLPQGAAAQADRALRNLAAVLEAAGSGLDRVLKVTIFLTSMSDFEEVNRIYAGFFDDPFPARSTVAVAGLPKGALVEMEVTAGLEGSLC